VIVGEDIEFSYRETAGAAAGRVTPSIRFRFLSPCFATLRLAGRLAEFCHAIQAKAA
jgi:hypothetical protein